MAFLLPLLALLGVPLAIGALLVRLAGIRLCWRAPGWIALALPLGLGVVAATAFLSLVVGDRVVFGAELALLAGLLLVRRPASFELAPVAERRGAFSVALAIVLAAVASVSLLAFLALSRRFPLGSWDAWAFWNTKARAFALGGPGWRWVFSQLVYWWHAEYPVLLPAAVARGWVLVGSESPLVPIVVAATFTSSSIVLVYWALRRLSGLASALLGALLLTATPRFVEHGASQYSDIPVGFFMLAALACLALYDADPVGRRRMLVLSGFSAGLAAFTKNEGMMFLASLATARSCVVLSSAGRSAWWREARGFGAGLAAPLAVVWLVKSSYAARPVASEFYSGDWSGLVRHVGHQLSDAGRYRGFFESWWSQLETFDGWSVPVLALLVLYRLLAGADPTRARATTRTIALWLALEVLGISAMFLGVSTIDITVHMDAVNRVLLQLLPAITLGVLSSARSPFVGPARLTARASAQHSRHEPC